MIILNLEFKCWLHLYIFIIFPPNIYISINIKRYHVIFSWLSDWSQIFNARPYLLVSINRASGGAVEVYAWNQGYFVLLRFGKFALVPPENRAIKWTILLSLHVAACRVGPANERTETIRLFMVTKIMRGWQRHIYKNQ